MAKTKSVKPAKATRNGTSVVPLSALDVLTLSEAAAYLRLPEEAVRAEAEAGRLIGQHVGNEWRFVRAGIVEWLQAGSKARGSLFGKRILQFPVSDETPEEQEAFLQRLRETRKSDGPVGGDDEDAAVIYLIDTDIFTLTYYGRHGLRERIAAVNNPDSVAISLMVRVEVLRGRFDAFQKAATGAELRKAQDQLAQSEAFLREFPVILFDPNAGEHFYRFRSEKRFKKMRGDLLIACIALAHKATLVTRNTKDFASILGLKVENWAD